MKIAVRRGHQNNGQDQGAQGIVKEIDVAERYYKKVIEGFKSLGHEVLDVTPEDDNRSLSNSLSYGINMANNWGADLFVSCHVNNAYSTYNGSLGCEVLYASGSSKGKEYATKIESQLANLGFKSRGAKEDVRGLAELRNTTMPAVIVEPFFVEATGDLSVYNNVGDEGIANAIVKGITGNDIYNSKCYVVTDYLKEGYHCNDDFKGIDIRYIDNWMCGVRWYLRCNDTGYWAETEILDMNKAEEVKKSLGSWFWEFRK